MLQASYLLLVEKSGAEKGIGSTELLYYNALLSLPFILGVRSLMDQMQGEPPSPHPALADTSLFALQPLCAGRA
jgi:hypothetical protein